MLEMSGFRLNYLKLETQKAREKTLRSLNLYKYLKILLTRSNRLKKGWKCGSQQPLYHSQKARKGLFAKVTGNS